MPVPIQCRKSKSGTRRTQRFAEIAEGVDVQRFALGSHWLSCHTENGIWHGAGDATKLERMLEVFLTWVEEDGS